MEPNVGVIANEIAHLRGDVDELKVEMKTVHKLLAQLGNGLTRLEGAITTVRAEMSTIRAEMGTLRAEMDTLRAEMGTLGKQIDARVAGLETRIIKWVIGTGISCAALAFTFAQLLK